MSSFLHVGRGLTRRRFLGSAATAPFFAGALQAGNLNPDLDSIERTAPPKTNPFNYHPAGLYVWDIWFLAHGDEVHLLHLQKKRPGSTRPDLYDGAIGHAVSTNLLDWKELPPALYRGPGGSIDDLDLFTGCALEYQGKFYLFYTARSSREKGITQRICLATSDNAMHWEKHPEPVIVPDPRWYTNEDCRDLIVQQHPETGEFHGFYAAGIPRKELVERNIIAHIRSRDLIHWTQEPPAFLPVGHAVVECPDVYFLGGRWWMTCNAGHQYGARAHFTDPYVTWGTIYASSDRLEGPYREGEDNVLIGSMEFNGFCSRSVVWKGRRYLFYGQGERIDRTDRGESTTGTLTTPKELRVSGEGQLRSAYCGLIEHQLGPELFIQPTNSQLEEVGGRFGASGNWSVDPNHIVAESLKSWSVRMCGPEAESFIYTADLSLENGRAIGLVFKKLLAVFLDYQQQTIVLTLLTQFQPLDSRRIHLKYGRSYRMRIIAKAEFFEVYLNDDLILNFVRYQPAKGGFGLYVETGKGNFSNIRAVNFNSV